MTRHDAVRGLYDRLDAAGVSLAQLDRFERDLSTPAPAVDAPAGVTVTVQPATDGYPPALDTAPLAPGDSVVLARREGTTVGWCLLSDRPVFVPELHRRRHFPGSYLWRLFVRPDARGYGVGTAIVRRAVGHATDSAGVASMTALVAPDNVPSRRAFRSLDFRPRQRYTSLRLAGHTLHRERSLDTER
jgi:ribosomal protein S18 acetylase RimI-like enzyme